MRKLAIDLGEKSLGVCISDKNNIIAIPIENYFFKRFDFLEATKIILNLLQKHDDIDTIIIGYPKRTDNKKSQATINVDNFLEIFQKKNNKIKIILFDERFTTKRAGEYIKENKVDFKANKDLFAACLMLTDYLGKV
ncbi:MAG: putative pre-16S rRNA nuclease [Candidatus Hepatoplasma scabrum]|nr:MAG: putative pre-16S rRNA nuclease [Candidatus Hepatoplasma sp.]